MAFLVDELRQEAEAAVATMRQAAKHARDSHARAELARHMTMTARNAAGRQRDEALRWMVDHWLEAWKLDRATCPHVPAMTALSAAFLDHHASSGEATDRAIRAAFAALEQAYSAVGSSIADEMAWRSGCAHAWWAEVAPPPANAAKPFWEHGCPAHCL